MATVEYGAIIEISQKIIDEDVFGMKFVEIAIEHSFNSAKLSHFPDFDGTYTIRDLGIQTLSAIKSYDGNDVPDDIGQQYILWSIGQNEEWTMPEGYFEHPYQIHKFGWIATIDKELVK